MFGKVILPILPNYGKSYVATDWSEVLCDYDIDSSFDKFMNKFLLLYDKNVPLRKCNGRNRRSTPRMPWITNSMLRSINKKNKLYYKYKTTKSQSSYRKYSTYMNTLTSILRAAKKNYYFAQFQATFNNIKGTWKIIRKVFKSTEKSLNVNKLKIDGNIVDDPNVIAEKFYGYFL